MRTMAKEDLTLTLGRAGIRGKIRLTNLHVGFYIDERAFLQVTNEIVRARVERKDVMPGSLGLWTSCQSDASTTQSYYACQTYCHQDQGQEGDNLSWQQCNYERAG